MEEEFSRDQAPGVAVNYEPTPVPVPPGKNFKYYQYQQQAALDELEETGKVPDWALPFGETPVAQWALRGKSFLASKELTPSSYAPVSLSYPSSRHELIASYNNTTETIGAWGTTQTYTGAGAFDATSGWTDDVGQSRRGTEAGAASYVSRYNSVHSMPFTTGAGLYAVWRWRLPTTAGQAGLTDRMYRCGLYTTVPTNTTDPAGHFIELQFRKSQSGNIQLRTKDGTTVSATDTGTTVALDTAYNCEIYVPTTGAKVYARINNGAVISKTTNLPGTTQDLFIMNYLVGQETDQGDMVLDMYMAKVVSF